jgi:long-subunit fatty acid transport protein
MVLCSALATASASPRSDPTTGRAVFTGASVASPTSVSLNPAALGTGQTGELYLALASVLEQLGVDRRAIDRATNTLVDAGHVSDTQLGAGGQLAFVWHPGASATLGVELRLPPPELFPDDPTFRYHARGTRQRNYIATAGTSLRVSSAFYFGFGLSHDVTHLRLRYARDTALDAGLAADCGGLECGFENPQAAEFYDVNVRSKVISTENLKLNIGILVRLRKDMWLGVAYHNTPGFGIQTQLDGTMDVRHAPRDGGGVVEGQSTVYVSYPASVDLEYRARLLPDLDLHVGGRWEDLSRMQAYDVRGYGVAFRGENIPEWVLRPRGFRDSFALWSGVEQVELDRRKRFRFGGRIGLETAALQSDRTSPGTVAPTSFSVDGGAQIRLAPNLTVQLSYGLQFFPTVGVERSEYDPRFAIDCAEGGFDYTTRACAALRNGYAIPTAAGDYARFQHALRLGFSYELP